MSNPRNLDERYLTLEEAVQLVPRHPSAGTIWRWIRRGVWTRHGGNVRLRHVRIGGRVYTTEDWIRQFLDDLASADLANAKWQHPNRVSAPPTRLPHDDDQAQEK